MAALLRTPITAVWGFLVGFTLLSWWLGTSHGVHSHEAASTVIVCVALFKARLVGLYFMELRAAPLVLRGIFEGYCAVVCAAILGFFSLA